jgi:hypothetical protein
VAGVKREVDIVVTPLAKASHTGPTGRGAGADAARMASLPQMRGQLGIPLFYSLKQQLTEMCQSQRGCSVVPRRPPWVTLFLLIEQGVASVKPAIWLQHLLHP